VGCFCSKLITMGDSKSATCAKLEGESWKIGGEELLSTTANSKSFQHSLGLCHKRPQEDSLLLGK
jgi:hypothetical protein